MQFGVGFQCFEKCVDTEYEDQHDENDGNWQMVPCKIGAADVEIVVRGGEALAYHCDHADEDTSRCESSVGKVGSLRSVLKVNSSGKCHNARLVQFFM